MTKILLLVIALLFSAACMPSISNPCTRVNSPPAPQSNTVENIFGREVMWGQDSFPLLVIIDPGMRDIRKQVVIEAINTWNNEVGIEIFIYSIEPLRTGKGIICVSEENLGGPVCGSQIFGMTTRYFDRSVVGVKMSTNNANVVLHIGVPNNKILGTTIHELGHCLNLNHDAEIISIMYPYSLPGRGGITQEDLEFVRRMVRMEFINLPDWYPPMKTNNLEATKVCNPSYFIPTQ